MRLTHVGITNFKNYARLEIDLPAGATIVHGDNAQGKTSLLEAVYYLANGRSFGPQSDTQLINWVAQQGGLAFARLTAQVQRAAPAPLAQLEVVLSLEPSGANGGEGGMRLRKGLRANGVAQRGLDWIGKLNVVLFVPTDLEIVTGPPSQRRAYLDHMLSQVDPRYAEALASYTKVLQQRNQHLKQLQERGRSAESVHMWDDQLVAHGTYLVLRRQDVMTALDELVQTIHPQLTGGRERLRLLYRPNLDLGSKLELQLPLALGADFSATFHQPQLDPADVSAHFYQRLLDGEQKELAQGMTLAGPHRDEMRFLVDGVDMSTYGSRGQQRSTAVGLKLAEMELMAARTGESPVLLLDDVLSELDDKRRAYLVGRIDAHEQTIITTCDMREYAGKFVRPVRALFVQDGILRRDEPAEPRLQKLSTDGVK